MAILKILQYPDLRLRQKAAIVVDIKAAKIQKIIDDMLETLANTAKCAGLSATQLDITTPPRITVIGPLSSEQDTICLINPQIIESFGSDKSDEGCMSVCPNEVYASVTRAAKIHVKAQDRDGNKLDFVAENLLARCIQHEIDHLNGILFIDHLSALKRSRIDKKVAKLRQD